MTGLRRGITTTELTPEMRYACRYWAAHVDECSEADSVLSTVETFAHGSMIFWLEAMCFMHLLYLAPSMLASVRKCIVSHLPGHL